MAGVKARPEGINYGSAGAGTPVHMGMELVRVATGIKASHIPYKGVAPALNDLMGGQVEAVFVDVGTGLPYVKSGRLKALAVSSAARSAHLPDVPTFAESGYPELQMDAWFGVVVKRGTPPAIVQKLNAAVISGGRGPAASTIGSARLQPFPRRSPTHRKTSRRRHAAGPRIVVENGARAEHQPGVKRT